MMHCTRRRGLLRAALATVAGLGHLAISPAAQAQPPAPDNAGKLPVLAWESLAQAQPASKKLGADVRFPEALDKLDGKRVLLTGFMVPLEAKAEQTRFLLTQQPQDCEFCIEGGPSRYVEVRSTPLRFSGKAFTLAGRLTLLRNDPSGLFYQLVDASQVAP